MNDEFKYIAIKNWQKYQAIMKNGNVIREWSRDYNDQDADTEISKLTGFQRYILSGCRRLRGRFGRNLPNDCKWIARVLCIIPKESHCVPQAIHKLTALGFLVLTNQQDDTPRGIEENRIEEKGTEVEQRELLGRREEDRFQPTNGSDSLIEQIVKSHPANFRISGEIVIPMVQSEACARALARDGPELVKQGTLNYARAVERWPPPDRKYIVNPVKFWNESHYLKDPREWERGTNENRKQQEINESVRRAVRAVAGAPD